MILFLGTRPGKTTWKELGKVSCPFCGQRHTLSVTITPNYFHVFWIPVFRISTSRIAECSHCKRAFFKEEFTAEMEAASGDQG